jgi:hypothetical protein
MPDPSRTLRFAWLAATLAMGAVGCRSLPSPRPALPTVPAARPEAAGGERGVLLDQMHQLAAEDASAVRR